MFNMNKLYLFGLDEYEKLVYLDADMLCLGDLRPLEHIEPWAMAPDYGQNVGASVGQRMMFNTGVMVLRPCKETFGNLVKTLRGMRFGHFADQAVINKYLNDDSVPVECLHPKWNLIISNKHINKKMYSDIMKSGVKFMHFTKIKPWAIGRGLLVEKTSSKVYLHAKDRLLRWRFKEEIALWKSADASMRIETASSAV
ncbi:hypothetical protein BSZ36_10810 [Rubricoccus marinus]|uniref:Nucleotide-diphospho-sugar transferase domain-containing protein n=2 Tax=Rubricoccus marinus TaxID=716817 RepID=A0A259U0Q7_9BACT|nr:hypothetical protein BSZ36_10810 [Rubricoccus marinus]